MIGTADLPPPGDATAARPSPLVVDMDDTLLRTDTLLEQVMVLLRHRPFHLPLLFWWLCRGKAHLKRRLGELVPLDVATLPVNETLLSWLVQQEADGRELHLYSAADQSIVTAVADHIGAFRSARGSDGTVNLSGVRKLAAIEAGLGSRFTYVGDSRKDLPIWRRSGSAVLVGAVGPLQAALPPSVAIERSFEVPRPGWRTWRRALRLHQWTKNGLLFVAVLLGGSASIGLPSALLGFLAFGAIASATYLLNDMLDLAHDRLHRSKRHRPLASGELPLIDGLAALAGLAVLSGLLLLALPAAFGLVAGLYLLTTLAYSFRIKRMLMLDVFTLAGLFTIRIGAGIAVVDHPVSPWLLAFSMFFFLSLACMKRYAECLVIMTEKLAAIPGRAYRPVDAPWLMAMGAGSAFSAMSTFFLFLIGSGSPILLYPSPRWMWPIPLILGYWLCRAWALSARGEMNDDPVLFAMKDRLSLLLCAATALLVVLSRSGPVS